MTTDWIIALATLLGPVSAVAITLVWDRVKQVRDRRMDVLRSLMRSRRMPLSADYVMSLNLIEVEFHNRPEIIQRFKQLIDKYRDIPSDEEGWRRWAEDEAEKKSRLIDAIANVLGIRVNSLDVFRGGYTPRAWHDSEAEANLLRRALLDLVSGNKALLVEPVERPPTPMQTAA